MVRVLGTLMFSAVQAYLNQRFKGVSKVASVPEMVRRTIRVEGSQNIILKKFKFMFLKKSYNVKDPRVEEEVKKFFTCIDKVQNFDCLLKKFIRLFILSRTEF